MPLRFDVDGNAIKHSAQREIRQFNGRLCTLETALYADYAFVCTWRADKRGNLVFRGTSQNLNLAAARAAKITIAEVEEVVETHTFEPAEIHLPEVFVSRIVYPHRRRVGAEPPVSHPLEETDDATKHKHATESTSRERGILARSSLKMQAVTYRNLCLGMLNSLQHANGASAPSVM